eukprot:scaffold291_cov92-Cylindrotheca_fusiformis.AAC.6
MVRQTDDNDASRHETGSSGEEMLHLHGRAYQGSRTLNASDEGVVWMVLVSGVLHFSSLLGGSTSSSWAAPLHSPDSEYNDNDFFAYLSPQRFHILLLREVLFRQFYSVAAQSYYKRLWLFRVVFLG